MRELENKVKPIALPLIMGENCRLFPDDQRILAAWLSLKAIIGEYAGMERTTTKAQRDRMWKEQLPPAEGWTVWIGDLDPGRYRALWVSSPFSINDDPTKTGKRASPNSCASSQVIGRLFAHVLRSEDHELVQTWHFGETARRSLRCIWPTGDTSLVWPPPALTDKVAAEVAEAVKDRIEAVIKRRRSEKDDDSS
jgi:hypothetical protein